MTKLADKRPPYCSGCYGHPEGRFVDFEAAYDGPVVPGAPANQPVDDLILCEGCLKEAFRILDPEDQRQSIEALEAHIATLVEDVAAKDKIIAGAELTMRTLVNHPIKKAPGKPPLLGLDKDQVKAVTQRMYDRSARSGRKKKANQKAAV